MEFPLWLVVTHFLNILFLTLLARSGIEVLGAHPKLYLRNACPPGGELVSFSSKRVAPAPHPQWTSKDEEEAWSPLLALPGRGNLGLGRHWHLLTVQFWVLTGVVYVALLVVSGEWRRLVPTEWSVVPDALRVLAAYLSGQMPTEHGYNAAQQLAYFVVVFVLAPLQVLTGAAMSPAVTGRFPRLAAAFGGRQAARTLHFVGLCALAAFTAVHTVMVVLHGLGHGLSRIALGSPTDHPALAVAVGAGGLLAVVAVNVAATLVSLRDPRRAQQALGAGIEPLEGGLSRLASRQEHARDEISPFFRVNGRPPTDDRFRTLAREQFAGYRLQVGGLVERPLALTVDELRGLGMTTQVTLHCCIQGWSGIAEWSGVPLAALLNRARVLPSARSSCRMAI
jgi:thiosulfate reductase cytochrome b subunit